MEGKTEKPPVNKPVNIIDATTVNNSGMDKSRRPKIDMPVYPFKDIDAKISSE